MPPSPFFPKALPYLPTPLLYQKAAKLRAGGVYLPRRGHGEGVRNGEGETGRRGRKAPIPRTSKRVKNFEKETTNPKDARVVQIPLLRPGEV